MKPKDLKPPFSWETRSPTLKSGVFFLPAHYPNYQDFSFPPWTELFGNSLPVKMEFCSGNGAWVVEEAKRDKESNWVGVEIRFDRTRKIWSKRENHKLSNLFLVCGDGHTFAHHYVRSLSVDEIFINFPDPWPKRRHEKHRLFKLPFVEELARILKPGGRVVLVTDDSSYVHQALSLLLAHLSFKPHDPPPHYSLEKEGYGTSFFEGLWRRLGREIYYVEFIKT